MPLYSGGRETVFSHHSRQMQQRGSIKFFRKLAYSLRSKRNQPERASKEGNGVTVVTPFPSMSKNPHSHPVRMGVTAYFWQKIEKRAKE
jgi:hypothetical protein